MRGVDYMNKYNLIGKETMAKFEELMNAAKLNDFLKKKEEEEKKKQKEKEKK